jgi:hypothetical protein
LQHCSGKSRRGGGLYKDVILTTAVAALPGSGTLVTIIEYCID